MEVSRAEKQWDSGCAESAARLHTVYFIDGARDKLQYLMHNYGFNKLFPDGSEEQHYVKTRSDQILMKVCFLCLVSFINPY